MSDAIFIVGYYRSGTSALSGALQRMGVKLYNEADPNEHNPLGFFEVPELIEFDVELFARLGVEWTDIRGLPEAWWERADLASFMGRLEEIMRRRFSPADPVWALKHPHLCRTLPLYERAARQAGHTPHAIHIFRDPWTAAASQQRKNGLSRAHALLLWMSYVTSGERVARHLPRSWLTYHDLLMKPAGQLARIEADLNIRLSRLAPEGQRESVNYLKTELNRAEPLAHGDLSRPLRELVSRTWEAVLARNFLPAIWDGFAEETADMVGFLTEIGASRARVIPAFASAPNPAGLAAPTQAMTGLRPAERLDDGGQRRLLALRDAAGPLPSITVLIIAPSGRAHAVNDTLESLRAQWLAPSLIKIISADPLVIPELDIIACQSAAGAPTRALCTELNAAAADSDYVAAVNAGDTLAPDAVLRFALAAAQGPDLIYCDEIVPREGSFWARHKPGWDVTRLRQSAYLGDWVWYRGAAVLAAGGFEPDFAGAEEYAMQLRLAETNGMMRRLAEPLFTRSPQSRRDDIQSDVFCAVAARAVTAHLTRAGCPADVQNRQHLGLFHHARQLADPGTAIIMVCDNAEIPALDRWLTHLLTEFTLTGPIILTAAVLTESMTRYLTAIGDQQSSLAGKVVAVPPSPGATQGGCLADALILANTEFVLILDARAEPVTPYWAEALRARLADPNCALAAARALVPIGTANPLVPIGAGDALASMSPGKRQYSIQGPIIIGADTRLGAGHLADDPGPGGWLIVDQEASAVAPPGLLARRSVLAACEFPTLNGDALWIDLGAQLRALGHRLVWTPDVTFIVPPEVIAPDTGYAFRTGTAAARALSWSDPYHHPALSLRGDLLAEDQRLGLLRADPADPNRLLLSGPPEAGAAVFNAVRALRVEGVLEAGWAPEILTPAEVGRLAPTTWLRVNPEAAPGPYIHPYTAIFTAPPPPEARAVIAAASACFATSPGLIKQVRKICPSAKITLWRPALSTRIWKNLEIGTGLNTKVRVLWVDEGFAPPWLPELMAETQGYLAWIVVGSPQATYPGSAAILAPPQDEQAWARELAALGPQILVRPAGAEAHADHTIVLMAAACSAYPLADDRLDLPASLGAVRLANHPGAWARALQIGARELPATLAGGKRARDAALALPSIEATAAPWARPAAERQPLPRSAAA